MDEKTARTKWCPHMRVNGNNRNYSVTEPESDRFRCIASDCMMWEWIDDETAPPDEEWKRLEDEMRRGDCGLKRKTYD